MPYKDPKDRNHKKEYQDFLANGGRAKQTERQRARRMYDKLGIDRTGKAIDHQVPIKDGGKSTKGNLKLRSFSANSADNYKSAKSTPKRKA